MTKQGRMKQTLYIDDSIVWLKKAPKFLLKIRKKNIDTENCNYPTNYMGLRLVSNDSINNNIKNL